MKHTRPSTLLLISSFITGCASTTTDKQELDYQSVNQLSPTQLLEVPPDLTSPPIQNKYALPTTILPQDRPSPSTQPTTGNTVASQATNTMKLERAGNERWLVVTNKTPQQLWPILKAFWQENGFVIKIEEPGIGIMETDWAENRAKLPPDMLRRWLEKVGLGGVYSTAQRDKFRIRVEKTTQGTEIYFSHRGMEELYVNAGKTETRWQSRPTDIGLEAELLTRFMMRLGMSEEQARASVKKTLEQNSPQANPTSEGTLNISDTFDRAWRRVGLALDRIGLVVNDRDRSKGIYYVKPAQGDLDTDKDSGFWSKLTFWKRQHQSNLATQANEDDMLVEVKETAPGVTTIRMINQQGQLLQNELARAILTKLAHGLQ